MAGRNHAILAGHVDLLAERAGMRRGPAGRDREGPRPPESGPEAEARRDGLVATDPGRLVLVDRTGIDARVPPAAPGPSAAGVPRGRRERPIVLGALASRSVAALLAGREPCRAGLVQAQGPLVGRRPRHQPRFHHGRAHSDLEVEGETPAESGIRRRWLTCFFPVREAGGAVTLGGATVIETTGRKRAEAGRGWRDRFVAAVKACDRMLYEGDPAPGTMRCGDGSAGSRA